MVFKHGAGILHWKESELKNVERKSRKTMTMYGALHSKSDEDRLYIKRKEGGRSLMSVECCSREEENSLGFYVANSEENLIFLQSILLSYFSGPSVVKYGILRNNRRIKLHAVIGPVHTKTIVNANASKRKLFFMSLGLSSTGRR